jgi:Fe-S oxidoreductase
MIPDACLHVIPSGCCGMAGSFGYEKKNFETSMAIGNMVLFPTIRQAYTDNESDATTFVCAPGTSCRQQIKEGTGIKAYHPIEILYKALRTRNTKNEFL